MFGSLLMEIILVKGIMKLFIFSNHDHDTDYFSVYYTHKYINNK